MSDTSNIFTASVKIITTLLDIAKENLEYLISIGRLSQEDGERILDEMETRFREGQKQYEQSLKTIINGVSQAVSRFREDEEEAKTQKLEGRIKSLELKVSLLVKEIQTLRLEAEKSASPAKPKRKAPVKKIEGKHLI